MIVYRMETADGNGPARTKEWLGWNTMPTPFEEPTIRRGVVFGREYCAFPDVRTLVRFCPRRWRMDWARQAAQYKPRLVVYDVQDKHVTAVGRCQVLFLKAEATPVKVKELAP